MTMNILKFNLNLKKQIINFEIVKNFSKISKLFKINNNNQLENNSIIQKCRYSQEKVAYKVNLKNELEIFFETNSDRFIYQESNTRS
jgi:hypothetical protein